MMNIQISLFIIYFSLHVNFVQAEICTVSPVSLKVVPRCPVNQEEWEIAAEKKNCHKFTGIDGCMKVKYHCLVNAHRNETVEICSTPRFLQGFCPIYTDNGPRNDYTRYCMNLTSPLNCSRRYLSTDSYKWQNCYEIKSIGRTEPIQTSDKSQEIGIGVAVFFLLAFLIGYVIFVVIYCRKHPETQWHEALCFGRNCPCTHLDSVDCCSENGKGKNAEQTAMLGTPAATPSGDNDVKDDSEEQTSLLKATVNDSRDGINGGTPAAGSLNKDTTEPIQASDVDVPYLLCNAGQLSSEEMQVNEPPLDQSVIKLEEYFEYFIQRLKKVAGTPPIEDLDFQVTSVAKKIEMFFKKPYQTGSLKEQMHTLKAKVREINSKLQANHQTLDDISLDTIDPHFGKQKGDGKRRISKPSTSQGKDIGSDAIQEYFHKRTGDGKNKMCKGNDGQNAEKQEDEIHKAENMLVYRMDDDQREDERHQSGGHFQERLSEIKIDIKKKEAKTTLLKDGANNTPSCSKDEKESSNEKESKIKNLNDIVTDLNAEFEQYKEENGELGNLSILQSVVWEIDAALNPLSEIYKLAGTGNSSERDIEQKLTEIERKLSDTKEYFEKEKERHNC